MLWNKNDMSLYKHGIPYIQHEKESKIDTREGWVNEKVNLWSSNFIEIVAKGYILLVSLDNAFKFGELGEDHVRIAISKIHVGLNNALQNEQGLHDLNVELLKWPINQVTFEDGQKLSKNDLEDDQ